MNKLTKEHQAKIDELRKRYDEARNELEAEQTNANSAISTAVEKVNQKITDLNAIVEEANSLREEVANDIQSYMDDRFDPWREGDRASSYDDWHSSWSDDEVETVEEVSIDDIDTLDDVPETLLSDDSFPTEPNF